MNQAGIKYVRSLLYLVALTILLASPCAAADGATIVFKSGQVVRIQDGFKDIAPEMKRLNDQKSGHSVVQLTLNGNTFLLNLAEVVILCRDDCRGLEVEDKRDPARQSANR